MRKFYQMLARNSRFHDFSWWGNGGGERCMHPVHSPTYGLGTGYICKGLEELASGTYPQLLWIVILLPSSIPTGVFCYNYHLYPRTSKLFIIFQMVAHKSSSLASKQLWDSYLLFITIIMFLFRFITCSPSWPPSWIFLKCYFQQNCS